MKQLIASLLTLLPCLSSFAQQPSYAFQTTFYFENAEGAKDTLTVSGDTLYTDFVGLDTTAYRGQVATQSDFTQKFRVFALPWLELGDPTIFINAELYDGFYPDQYRYFYRNLVVDYDSLHGTEDIFLLFKCKQQHMPITVTWDYTYYAGLSGYNLLKGGHFIPEHTQFSQQDFWPYVHYDITIAQCLRYNGQWTFHLGDDTDYNLPYNKVFGFLPGSADTLYGMVLNFSPYYNCSTVGTSNPDPGSRAQISLSPNPSDSETLVRSDQSLEAVRVLDRTGRVVFSQSDIGANSVQVRLTNAPPGVYFVEVYGVDRRRLGVLKWVKM